MSEDPEQRNKPLITLDYMHTELISSIHNKNIKNISWVDIKQKIVNSLFHSSKNTELLDPSLPEHLAKINEIITSLKQCVLITEIESTSISEFLILLEELLFVFLFHHNFTLTQTALTLQKFLTEITAQEYSDSLWMNQVKLIQIINTKRATTAHPEVLSIILSNVTFALTHWIMISPVETKKILFDFIKSNYQEHSLISLFCLHMDDNLNFTHIYSREQLLELLDKYRGEYDKHYKIFEAYLLRNIGDNTVSSRVQISHFLSNIGNICKIIDCLTIRGHRKFGEDKIIKNLIPTARKLLHVISTKIITPDINIQPETIHDIICFCKVINAFDKEYLLWLLNFNQIYLASDLKYWGNTMEIISLLTFLTWSDNGTTSTWISQNIQIILTILENVWKWPELKTSISSQIRVIKIFEWVRVLSSNNIQVISESKFPNCYSLFIKGEYWKCDNMYITENFEYYTRIYKNASLDATELKTAIDKDTLWTCVNKFEDFKAAMLKVYANKDIDTGIENQLSSLKERLINCDEVSNWEEFEKCFLDCSIDMYSQLFHKEKSC